MGGVDSSASFSFSFSFERKRIGTIRRMSFLMLYLPSWDIFSLSDCKVQVLISRSLSPSPFSASLFLCLSFLSGCPSFLRVANFFFCLKQLISFLYQEGYKQCFSVPKRCNVRLVLLKSFIRVSFLDRLFS